MCASSAKGFGNLAKVTMGSSFRQSYPPSAENTLRTGQSKNTLAVQAHRGVEMLKVLYNISPKHTLTRD